MFDTHGGSADTRKGIAGFGGPRPCDDMELWRASLDDGDALLPLLDAWKASLPEGGRSEAWLDAIATVAVEPQA